MRKLGARFSSVPSPAVLETRIRALCKYDPAFTPQNLWRVRSILHSDRGFIAKPWFKRDLLNSAIRYTYSQKMDITSLAFQLLSPGPERIPTSAILELVRVQRYFQNDELVLAAWKYLTGVTEGDVPHSWDLPVPLYLAFLRYFAPKRRFKTLATDIADYLESSQHIDAPMVALAITRTRISCGDCPGATRVAEKVRLVDRPLAGALLVAYAALGDDTNARLMMMNIKNGLSASEIGGIVRNMAGNDIQQAVDFLESSDADDNTKQLAFLQLLNRAITDNNKELFDDYMLKLQKTLRHSEGMRMNLAVKWEAHHGTFESAKLEYQIKAESIHPIHRIGAFRQLNKLSRSLDALEGPSPARDTWLSNEASLFKVRWADIAPEKRAENSTTG